MTTNPSPIATKALIVDQAVEMRSALSRILTEARVASVDHASKQSAALGLIQKNDYDVILCDYDLGGGQDGIHLFEACQQHNLLKPSCIFMMITGERRMTQVMGAAELVPDGYLLKPFSAADFIVRLERARRRKAGFRHIDNAVRAGDYVAAIAACDAAIAKRAPNDADEFLRIKANLQLRMGEAAQAAETTQSALEGKDSVWARVGLGKAQFALKDYVAARTNFETVKAEHELALESYDWLARTLTLQGDTVAAQAVLGEALQRSPLATQRQSAMGRLAERNGDLATAEAALSQAINLTRGSFWPDLSLYCELSRVQLARNDIGGAQRTAQRLRRESAGAENVGTLCNLIEASVMDKQQDRQGAQQLFKQTCDALLSQNDVAPGVLIEAARQAYGYNDKGTGVTLVRAALRSALEDASVLAAVENLYQGMGEPETGRTLIAEATRDFSAMNTEAVNAMNSGDLDAAANLFMDALQSHNGNIQLLLNAIGTLLASLNQRGWNEQYMEQARNYLARARKLDPSNGKVRELAESLDNMQTHFGIDASSHGAAEPPASVQ